MNARLILLLALGLAVTPLHADDDDNTAANASALVVTQPVKQGTLALTTDAYGSAASAPDAAVTLNVQAMGQVSQFEVVVGERVSQGQRLLQFALSPTATAAYTQAQSALSVARQARQHIAQLLAQQLATRDQLAQADKAVSDAQSTLDALTRQQGTQATTTLKAPFDGAVTSIAAAQGDTLQAGAPILTLTRSHGTWIDVGVDPAQSALVNAHARVQLFPLDGGQSMQGTVHTVGGVLNPHTRLVDVYIVPDQPVLLGEAYRAALVIGRVQGWLIPRDAVIATNDGGWCVFQVAQGKAQKVPVKVLGEAGAITAVNGALDAKLPIVITGGTQLDDGMAVRTPGDKAGKP